MADHKISVAVSLLVFSLFGLQQVNCQQDGFQVFRTGSELREFQQFSARERLDSSLRFPGAAVLELTGASQAATVQEGVSLNIDCFPWLQRFPGGSIQWYSTQLDEFGDPDPMATRTAENPTPPGTVARITVGGEFNRWLNISRIDLVGGAEDPDSKIFECEVCIARGTPFEQCHTANYTNQVIGGPPVITVNDTMRCIQVAMATQPGDDGGIVLTETRDCTIPNETPRPVPPPTVTWFRNGEPAASATFGESFTLNMSFLDQFPFLTPGVFSQLGGTEVPAFQVLTNGQLTFTTNFQNISDPMLGNLAPGTTLRQARAMVFDILLANWTCAAVNSLGESSVANIIRVCGDAPIIPDCSLATGSSVLFPEDGDAVPPGCSVCIRPRTSVTLNCMVSAGTPPIAYSWTLNNTVVSRNARLVVREPGNYACTASNLDNVPVVEASVLFFSPRATLTSKIAGRATDGCDRLRVTDQERAAIRSQFDTCIFVGETLEVECASSDPTAVLALMSEDGTMYVNGTASFEVTLDNINAANMTFLCSITNAPGPCGGFVFRSAVVAYDPATIEREVDFAVITHIGAGRPGDVLEQPINQPVTLRCPTSGITEETTQWRRVVEDSTGCFVEQPITDMTNGFTITQEVTGTEMFDDLVLTINNFNASFEGTYVCRTENIAGVDADVVSLVTGLGEPEWRTTNFSACSMMCQDGVRTRSVTCRNDRNQLLIPDFMCPADMRPGSSLMCSDLFPLPCFLDPVWVPYPWSRCSQDCKGTRTRDVLCQIPRTGAIRPNYECNHITPKPARSEVCPDRCCVSDVLPNACSILGTGHCGLPVIQKFCCWTCGLTVIP